MRKIFLVLGAVLIVSGLSGSVSAQTTRNQYPTKPADAATINDIQGQVRGGYFQENSLRQDAGGVSQNPNGAANILKNSNDQQKIVVVGALPEATVNNDKNVPWFGLVIFLAVMLAPLVLILNMLKRANEQKLALASTANVSSSLKEVTGPAKANKTQKPATTTSASAEPDAEVVVVQEEVSEEVIIIEDKDDEKTATEAKQAVAIKADKKSIPLKPKKHKKKSKKGKKKKK